MAAKKAAGASTPARKSCGARKEQQLVFKGYLESPFVVEWPQIPKEHHASIKQLLEDFSLPPKVKKLQSKAQSHGNTQGVVPVAKTIPRSDVVFGINGVARALERNSLELVLVCRSAQPPLLTRHLLLLAHSTGTAVCALPEMSVTLGKLGGIGSATAVGIRKGYLCESPTATVLQSLSPLLVPTDISWLSSIKTLQHAQGTTHAPNAVPTATSASGAPSKYIRATLRRIGFPRKTPAKAKT